MRSHAKASTAGSTQRQAKGLGLFFAALALAALIVFATSGAFAAEFTGHVKSFGPDGTESSDFERVNGVAVDQQSGNVYVLDGIEDVLHKFDAEGQPLDWGASGPNITGNVLSGISSYEFRNSAQVAVDSTSHLVYVTEEHSVRAFQTNGEAAEFTAGPGAGTNAIPGFSELRGVATDASGNIYASDFTGSVSVYAPSGEQLTGFAAPQPGNVTVAPGGAVYFANDTSDGGAGVDKGVHKFVPSEFPVTATTTYTAGPMLEWNGAISRQAVGVGVDPLSGDVYVLTSDFTTGLIKQYDSSGAFLRSFGAPGEEGELAGGWGAGIAIVGGGEEFQFYVGNSETGSEAFSKVEIFGEVINPGPPSIGSTRVTGVSADAATLHAEINPNTAATTYHFEYGLGDCAVSACTSVPLGGAAIGSGHRPVAVSQLVTGLQAATTYHFRVLAENSFNIDPSEGPDRTFTTQVSGLGFELADRRAWEMVSPPKKFSGNIRLRPTAMIQAAADGNGLVYPSIVGSLDKEPDGNRSFEESDNLARRGAGGWHSKDITPPHTKATPIRFSSEYRMFTPDLAKSLLDPYDGTLLSPQASEWTTYLRENTEPANYTPLVTGKEGFANVPPGTVFGEDDLTGSTIVPLETMGANSALTHIVLVSHQAGLTPGAPLDSLYMWSDGQLQLINQLPVVAEGGGIAAGSKLGSDKGSVRHAVSEDGSRVFWGTGFYTNAGNDMTALYARDTEAEETVRLDVAKAGASEAGDVAPAFQGASADGAVVFFTDSHQLTADAGTEGRDLYRCVVSFAAATPGCSSLTDISANPGESAQVQDMTPAISEDGTHVYFIAEGVLDAVPNEAGESAAAGEPNLYLWQQGEGVRFIATLAEGGANFAEGDDLTWGRVSSTSGFVSQLSAAASPGGRYFSFMSERSLTDYDTRDAISGKPVIEVYRYDALVDRVDCVSCNPTGAGPVGQELTGGGEKAIDPQNLWSGRVVAATLPEAVKRSNLGGSSFYRPRAVLENGRVFFNAIDSLVPADSNGEWDVYEYEPTGVGDCTPSSSGASLSRTAGSCVSLLSSGTAEEESAFLDASESGDDVFFLTSARLSVTDEDSEPDVYDARVDGVPAKLSPSNECLGEACQPPALAPNDPTPASATFKGQGNVKANARKRCAKGKRQVRRGGKARCVTRKQRRQKSKAKRAGKNGRADR